MNFLTRRLQARNITLAAAAALLLLVCPSSGASTLDFGNAYNNSYPNGTVTAAFGPTTYGNADNTLTFSGGPGLFNTYLAGTDYTGTVFANGTYVLIDGGVNSPFSGAVTLSFSSPVTSFSLSIEDYWAGFLSGNNPNAYTVSYSWYNGATPLGTGSASGSNDGTGTGSLSSESAAVSGNQYITSVTFDDSALSGSNNLVFGPVAYTNYVAPINPPPAVTPEPGTFVDLLSGFLLLIAAKLTRERWQTSAPAL